MKKRLRRTAAVIGLSVCLPVAASSVDSELFELGAAVGVINLEDFSSEFTIGLNGTFRATENFFLQFNYLQSDVALSAVEESPQGEYTGTRDFRHLNLLLGFNIFQGEVFRSDYSGLSSMYAVAGVGDTDFLDESNFTYVVGIGYQMALSRRYTLRFDYRTYLYDSIIVDQEETSTNNSHLSVGLTWLF